MCFVFIGYLKLIKKGFVFINVIKVFSVIGILCIILLDMNNDVFLKIIRYLK